jgi:hypothetical protein
VEKLLITTVAILGLIVLSTVYTDCNQAENLRFVSDIKRVALHI